MRISVVIPVLEDRLELCAQVQRLDDFGELIVVDASTLDPIQCSDLPEGAQLISSAYANRAYQQNLGLHPFEDNEEQRYIKFVRGNLSV